MKHIALVCKLMPHYRLGVFHELSEIKENYEFTCFGDVKKAGGIETIPWSLANNIDAGGINWVKTSNYFYYPEYLLWQTGIIKLILFSDYKYFIFEGAVKHLPTWLFAILCRITGKKALFWTHGFKGLDKGFTKIIRTLYFRLANALLLYGDYSKDLMIKNGFFPNKLFVIYNSLDVKQQLRLLQNHNANKSLIDKKSLFSDPDVFTMIFIGRLVKSKNIKFLLDAVKDLSDKKLRINCIIIGDGPEMEDISKFINTHKLQNCIYCAGALYHEDQICNFFLMSDLMVSPGNVGLNCIHSLAYGVPVLTHDNLQFHGPEAEAIVVGKTGLLFKYADYYDMLLKIQKWINIGIIKEEIKENCQKVILSRYNPSEQAANIIKAIDSL